MHFKILDPNVGIPMNVFIIIGNFITLFQNIPQVIKTYQVKSTRDFSSIFLFMRLTACFIWGAYSIEIDSLLMLINNLITLSSTIFIGYYKVNEIIYDYKSKKIIMYAEIQDLEKQDETILET
uniref:PQ-loop repeat-containing protein n=1 Tax=viral metagenome TaxID=1070528 RepID=A0A6C0HX77_9ZZZZ